MSDLPLSITRGAKLGVVAREVSRASAFKLLVYVERRGDIYRWSPAHQGGPYPLLRTVAQVLKVDYHTIMVPCAPVPNGRAGFGSDGIWEGLCIVPAPRDAAPPDASTVLKLEQATKPAEVQRILKNALND